MSDLDTRGSTASSGHGESGHGRSVAQTTTGQAASHGASGDDPRQRMGQGDNLPSPLSDPGLPVHRPRPTDVDPAQARRAERQVVGMFVVSSLATIGFVVAYVLIPTDATFLNVSASNLALGASLGLGLFLIGIAAIQWAKKLMVDEEVVEERHTLNSTPQERAEAMKLLTDGARESGLTRRTLIAAAGVPALGLLVVPVVVLLRDLGPLPGEDLKHTSWARGVRVVQDGTGNPIRAAEVPIGSLINVEPGTLYPVGSGGEYDGPTTGETATGDDIGAPQDKTYVQDVRARSAAIVVRIAPGEYATTAARADWNVGGVFCYSKICVHMGCPISLYEHDTHHLLCPCHQSIYDLADGGKNLFGPAGRNMPQLPIMVDGEGYLVAQSDFTEPVGPSFWERGRT